MKDKKFATVSDGKIISLRRSKGDIAPNEIELTTAEFMLLNCHTKLEVEALSLIFDTKQVSLNIQAKLDGIKNEQS